MKKPLLFLACLFSILLAAHAISAQWSCPKACDCTGNLVSVACFGAVPDDQTGDSAAIQNAIDSVPDNWTVFFPAGVYLIDIPLEIGRSNINLIGAGIQSELRTPQNTNYPLLNLPRFPYTIGCPQRY